MSQAGQFLGEVIPPTGFVEFLTGNVGGPVPPNAGNINIVGTGLVTVTGNPGTNTLTISVSSSISTTFNADSGSATPVADILNLFSGGQGRATPDVVTIASGNTVDFDLRNAITLGDLSNLGSASDALTLVTGNETIAVGNLTVSQGLIFATGSSSNRGGAVFTSTKAGVSNDAFVQFSKNPGVALQPNESIGNIQWAGTDSSSTLRVAANIVVTSTTNPPVGNVPSQMTFFTSGAFSGSTARMALTSPGGLRINAPDSGVGLQINGGGLTSTGTTTLLSLGAGAVSSSAGGVLSSGTLSVANGGTGATTLTAHGVLVGEGTSAITALTVGTNGQVLVGSTGADPAFATLSSSDSSITFTPGAASLSLQVTNFVTTTSWTPVLKFGGGTTGIVYTAQTGSYSRIGKMINFTMQIAISAKGSSTGAATVTGFPVAPTANTACVFLINGGITAAGLIPECNMDTSGVLNLMTYNMTTGASATLADTNFAAADNFIISGSLVIT